MIKKKANGARKALSMSEQNAASIRDLREALDRHAEALNRHAKDESDCMGTVKTQVADLHGAWFGDIKDPDRKGFAEQIRDGNDRISLLEAGAVAQSKRIDDIVKEARWTGGLSGAASVVAAALVALFVGPQK